VSLLDIIFMLCYVMLFIFALTQTRIYFYISVPVVTMSEYDYVSKRSPTKVRGR